MPFEKGNKAAAKARKFYDALNVALGGEYNPRRLRSIAEKLVVAAEAGEQWAIKEVADRLDGKPAQTTDLNVNDNRPLAEYARADLADIIANARTSSGGTDSEDGRGGEPDSVH